MTDKTITIYFCGSGNNRRQNDEFLIPDLFLSTEDPCRDGQTGSTIIFDGPGGPKRWVRKKFYTKTTKNLLLADVASQEERMANLEKAQRAGKAVRFYNSRGGVNGASAVSNVMQAWIWASLKLEEFGPRLKNINLVGFSRGGYSCIWLAKVLQHDPAFDQNQVNVNIFAFDPVPGGKGTKTRAIADQFYRIGIKKAFHTGPDEELPPIVKKYHSIVQAHIKRRDCAGKGFFSKHIWFDKDKAFRCVVPTTQNGQDGQEIRIIPMPGVHRASVSLNERQHTNTAKIGRHLCVRFLTENGTKFDRRNHILTDADLLKSYSEILDQYCTESENGIKRIAPSTYRGRILREALPGQQDVYLERTDYVNDHHYHVAQRRAA